MKIDVGEGGTRAAGVGAAEDNEIHGTGGIDTGVTRSDATTNRAVAVAQEQAVAVSAAAAAAAAAAGEGTVGEVESGVGGTNLPTTNGIFPAGRGASVASDVKIVTLSARQQQQHGGNIPARTALLGRDEYQGGVTTATAGRASLSLHHSTILAPPEENGSPGSATPPADTGGDPCPSCSSPFVTQSCSPETAAASGQAVIDPSLPCRCGDKAQGGHTGGEPVAAADAVAVESAGGGGGVINGCDISSVGRGYGGQQETSAMVLESGRTGGGGVGEPQTTTVVGMAPARPPLQQYVEASHTSLVVAPNNQRPSVNGETTAMLVDVKDSPAFYTGEGEATTRDRRDVVPSNGGVGGSSNPWSIFSRQESALMPPGESAQTAGSYLCAAGGGDVQQQQDIGALQSDTMDRLAQSLAQAQQLALSVEARQTELLARPKRRSHASSKQETATQSRKVKPKGMPQGAKLPKLEQLGIKVEPSGTTPAATATAATAPVAVKSNTATREAAAAATTTPSSAVKETAAAAAAARGGGSSGPPMPKQRLLIKIPRAAVTAATAHAAEVAKAAKKEERATGGDTKPSKRGKGKGGVKRARPLAGTRASLPAPPPPAPSTRQELPPGCGPPCPSLAGIFGWDMDEEELNTARDGEEHLQTSQASRRLTAQSTASPKELASHVQALRLDYLVQKVRPILTKLMSAGTGPQRGLFNVPVDPLKLGIPDYFKRVSHPMDLGTVKSRLLSMSYTLPDDFASDVRLVFTNAIGFNPESHFVHTWAVQLLNEFDQEYSKQIGKLDEGWAKSLSHACQLCQGQTCVLCGDKCLKLEPPVIICHHCNKRVVRGGVYHITRDGCRLWCSRCHPGLPPELPTDGDPEELLAEDAAEGSGGGSGNAPGSGSGGGGSSTSGGGSSGAGAGTSGAAVGVGASASNDSTETGMEAVPASVLPASSVPPTTGDGAASASAVSASSSEAGVAPAQPSQPSLSESGAPLSPPPPPPPSGLPTRTTSPPAAAAAAVGEGASGGGGGSRGGCALVRDGHGSATGGGGRETRTADVAEGSPAATTTTALAAAASGRAASGQESPGGTEKTITVARRGSSGGGDGGAVAAAAVEEVKAPLKRDLLRRKFDEEISEPWVQCDRCNSWVHQVCALFNARANVGEARFVCPLCRLRSVVTDKPRPARTTETASEVSAAEDLSRTRKRPKSIDGNGNLVPPRATKTEETAAAAASPSTPVPPPTVAQASPAAAAAPAATAETSASPTVSAGKEQVATFAVNGAINTSSTSDNTVGIATEAETTAAVQGAAPMEGVVVGTLTAAARGEDTTIAAVAAAAAAAVAATATPAAATLGGATPSLERLPAPSECPSAPPQEFFVPGPSHLSSSSSQSVAVAAAAVTVPEADGDRPAGEAAAAAAEVPEPGGLASSVGGGCDRTASTTAGAHPTGDVSGPAAAPSSAAPNGEVEVVSVARDRRDEEREGAEGAAAVPTAVAAEKAKINRAVDDVKDPMEVDEDVGAEAAGDAASGSAAADNFDVYAASSLPHTPLSRYIESRVRQRLAKLEDDAAAATLSIRLISNVEATCEVHAVLRETFCCKDGHGVGPNKNDVPELLKYRSKALSMFQRVDGVEVCLFSMYVQEYGADAPYFNARRAYISYLDSVEYFRPRKHRTAVYHEILVAYLDWLRRRGFKAAHIWSCPPQRGNNFIFWCHPLHQKTPTRDRLSGWYGNMLKRAVQLGVAAKVTTLDKTHFTEVERIGILLKNRRTSAAASAAASLAGVKGPDDLPLRPEIPVIFEGDFWAEEAVRLARAVERRDDGAEDTQSPLELCRHALEELLRHQHGAPFAAPVDPTRDRCPDYLVVIEQPMDLGTVAETLDAMKYHDAGAFVRDVRLIFDNARKYNPPKHPIHVAASKLSKVFDKTVRALESAVNRLPGMHEMGLEHLLLEEPAPPAPATPTVTPATPGAAPCAPGTAAAAAPPRPTAPGKRSIPWAYDAIGPLSALARKTWAAHCARTARAVGTLPSMSESSPVEVGMPPTIPACRALSGAPDLNSAVDPSPAASERLSRSGSTAVMSVSEFYGPSGARMLQRRSSTASQLSLADSYGEGEALESASSTKDNREGQAALSILMAAGAESEHQSQQQQQSQQEPEQEPNQAPQDTGPAAALGTGGMVNAEPAAPQASSPPAGAPGAQATLLWPPAPQQAVESVAPTATAAVGGESPGQVPSVVAPVPASAAATVDGTGNPETTVAHLAEPGVAGVVAKAAPPAAVTSQQSLEQGTPLAAAGALSVSALPTAFEAAACGSSSCGTTQGDGSPPPLTLDAPHPSASDGSGGGGAASSAATNTQTQSPPLPPLPAVQSRRCDGSPASSLSLPSISAPGVAAASAASAAVSAQPPLEQEPMPDDAQNKRVGLLRAMSVDSASSPAKRPHARTMSFAGGGSEFTLSGMGGLRSTSVSDMFGPTVNGPGGSGSGSGSVARLTGGGGGAGGGATPHSPRLRAKSMDSGGRKGKSKRGKGPGSAVMGKADRIGRMLQSLSRAVTRISKDLLVVTLGRPDKPATPPAARAGSGMTKETMLAELEAWHASAGLEGVLTPDCHDPDPTISRALVDARHTFLEMCQFRHYQFDTLRRAKHSSAMVLYHLHRPESRSLNPFCSRCHRPVRFVRYHCGVCNYDLCAECDEEVGTKCEDGHPLTPYRVTFSTEDAEKSPAPGRTPATGGTGLSPQRPSASERRSPVRDKSKRNVGRNSPSPAGSSAMAAAEAEAAAATAETVAVSGAIPAAASTAEISFPAGAARVAPSALPVDSGSGSDGTGRDRQPSSLLRDLRGGASGGGGGTVDGGTVNDGPWVAAEVAAAPVETDAASTGGANLPLRTAACDAAAAAAAVAVDPGGQHELPESLENVTGVATEEHGVVTHAHATAPLVDVGGEEGRPHVLPVAPAPAADVGS